MSSPSPFRYSTEGPPCSIPDVARIKHGPSSSIMYRLSFWLPTCFMFLLRKGLFSLWNTCCLIVLFRYSGYAVCIAVMSHTIPSMCIGISGIFFSSTSFSTMTMTSCPLPVPSVGIKTFPPLFIVATIISSSILSWSLIDVAVLSLPPYVASTITVSSRGNCVAAGLSSLVFTNFISPVYNKLCRPFPICMCTIALPSVCPALYIVIRTSGVISVTSS